MADETIRGTFLPPAMGHRHVPIPLGGPGTLTLRSDRLVATGFKSRSSALGVLVFLVALPVMLGLAWLATRPFTVDSAKWIGSGIVGAMLAGAATPRGVNKKRPWTLEYEWSAVKKVEGEPGGGQVVIVIKGGKPKGALHLIVDGGPPARDAAMQAIRARLPG